MGDDGTSERAELNEHQARWLRVTFERIDQVLGEIEVILAEPATTAAFPRYIADVTPAQRRMIEEYCARVRERLITSLARMGIPIEEPSIPASRAIQVALISIDDTAEELKPRRMRRWGAIPEAALTDLGDGASEVQALVRELRCILVDGVTDSPVDDGAA